MFIDIFVQRKTLPITFLKMKSSNFAFFSLLSRRICLNSEATIQRETITFDDPADMKNPYYFDQIVSKTIWIIKITGDKFTELPAYQGFDVVSSVVIETTKVTEIPAFLFANKPELREVTLPDSIKTIGNEAFSKSGIEDINLDKVESIGTLAFFDCVLLSKVTLTNIKTLSPSAFERSGIKEVTIPDSITVIPAKLFKQCAYLTNVTTSSKVTTISAEAFCECTKLSSINAFDNLIAIGDSAFKNTLITEFTIAPSVSKLGDSIFYESALKSVKFSPNLKISLPRNMFYNCHSLTDATLNDMILDENSTYCFYGCSNLQTVEVNCPDVIPCHCFCGCSSLTTIKLKSTKPKKISNYAFQNCVKLAEYDFTDVTEVGSFAFSHCTSLTAKDLKLPQATINYYAFEYCTNLDFKNIYNSMTIKENSFFGCTKISSLNIETDVPDRAFMGCTRITKIVFGENVLQIGEYSFAFCTNLKEITFGKQLTTVKSHAFAGCGLSGTLNLNQITTIGQSAFAENQITKLIINNDIAYDGDAFIDCKQLTTVEISNTLKIFPAQQFSGCKKLVEVIRNENDNFRFEDGVLLCTKKTELIMYMPGRAGKEYTIPVQVRKLDEYAFSYAEDLERVILNHYISLSDRAFMNSKIKEFVYHVTNERANKDINEADKTATYFGKQTFYGCEKLKKVSLKSKVFGLGMQCFANCKKLESITQVCPFSSLGESCFANCSDLKSVDISNVDTIPFMAFVNCKELSSVVFSDKLLSIRMSAFQGSGLTQVILPDSPYKLGLHAFENCLKLTTLTLGNKITFVPFRAFANTRIGYVTIPASLVDIHPTAFALCSDVKLVVKDHPVYQIDGHDLIEKSTGKLILTFGDLGDTYTVSKYVKIIASNSIQSNTVYNKDTNAPTKFGTYSIIIPSTVETVELSAFDGVPFLYNLCYQGSAYMPTTVNAHNVIVSNSYVYDKAFGQSAKQKDKCKTEAPDYIEEAQESAKFGKFSSAAFFSVLVLFIIALLIIIICIVLLVKKSTRYVDAKSASYNLMT